MPISPPDVRSAGVVVFRPGKRVLLVHRPKYDDWSFPKGKIERGEHATAAAVREAVEETGLHVRLGPPLAAQTYAIAAGRKSVQYWTARVVGADDVSHYRPNAEIDDVRWVDAAEAAEVLTYSRDRETLAEALPLRRRTRAVVLLRHAKARSRAAWHHDDRERPLLQVGQHQAEQLVPLLAAYGVTRVLSSPSRRCVQSLEPYAVVTGWEVEPRRRLSEEDTSTKGVARVVDDVLGEERNTVICTHRPVLPTLMEAFGVGERALEPVLEPGAMLVLHLRKREVIATEAI